MSYYSQNGGKWGINFGFSDEEKQKMKNFKNRVSTGLSNMKKRLSNSFKNTKRRFGDWKEDRAYKQALEAKLKAERLELLAQQGSLRRSSLTPSQARRASLALASPKSTESSPILPPLTGGGHRRCKCKKNKSKTRSKKSKTRSRTRSRSRH